MLVPPSIVKLLKIEFENEVFANDLLPFLFEGKLYEFEKVLHERLLKLYDKISGSLIRFVSSSEVFLKDQRALADRLGLKKLVSRPVELQLRTGTKVRYESLYSKSPPPNYEGSRHLSMLHWSLFSKSSPMYQSLNCLFSVVCPSFDLARSILDSQGVKANFERTRNLSLGLAGCCMEDRAGIQLADGESLKDKRVVISIDGGRTRTKVYKEERPSKREQKFDSPWREPKLFVITTIDAKGKVNKEELPIYDSSFGDDETFGLLKEYLKRLKVEEAENVQFIADGAPWIWNRAKPMLLSLGVKSENIIETLDYYHAMEHLNEMVAYVEKEQRPILYKEMKEALWAGNINELEKLVIQGIPDVDTRSFTPFKYFYKNRERIGYQSLKEQKRPLGSGVIESGIRRIINLRFKSPSTFWYPENVEKLILMRAIALSGRWEIMMQNLTKV